MGKVYLAHHPGIGRRSAIKVLHPNLAGDPAAVSRFFTEARASNAIRHPNIVEIFDSGTLENGAPYIIMEHLEGQTLAATMARGLPLGPALDLACQAASALAAAHAQEIVHRDLKPENLFVIDDPRGSGRPVLKVLDFGVAKLQRSLEEPAHRTRSGALVGTPRYMSPEQCLGEMEVDARSDIYSLGVIVYEMVSGRPPFVTEGVGAVINMHINRPPDPPRQLNPAISASLESAILRALAKNRSHRFASMAEFLLELRQASTTLGEAHAALPPRTTDVVASAPTPTPLSAMATLMDARPETMRSTPPPPPPAATPMAPAIAPRSRRWVLTVVGVVEIVAAVMLLVVIRPNQREGTQPTAPAAEPQQQQAAPPVVLPAIPPAAAAPAEPATGASAADPAPSPFTRVHLDSEPPGATVRAGTQVLGVTPLVWETKSGGDVVELSFARDGYRRELIYTVPAPGLRLRPKLRKSVARRSARPEPAVVRSSAPDAAPPVPDDIKSER